MKIELGNVRAHVVECSDEEHLWLDDYLSWPDDKAWVMKARGRTAPPPTRLYDQRDCSYPAGFTRMLVGAARTHGFQVEVVDRRTRPAPPAPLPLPSYLRDYQAEAVRACAKRARGVVWAATGAGKTQIAMGLVESIPARWLFLVNQTQLGLQARERYRAFCGLEAGLVAEGEWRPDKHAHGLTVATFQTLWARLKLPPQDQDHKEALRFLRSIDGVIVDECHVLPADTFRATLDQLGNAFYRIGLSATPLQRGDRKSMHLIGCLGSVLYRISARTLIEAGVLARPIIKLVSCEQETERKSWQGAYTELIVKSRARNALIARLTRDTPKPAVVFVKQVEHGQQLLKLLRSHVPNVEYVDGGTPTPMRQAAVTRLERGDTDVIIATVVMNQGIDIPNLASVVMAASGASPIEALQRVGRGMRKVPGKDVVHVWDVNDVGCKWTERWTKDRIRAYGVEEYDVEVVE